jgi:hypothetical protein
MRVRLVLHCRSGRPRLRQSTIGNRRPVGRNRRTSWWRPDGSFRRYPNRFGHRSGHGHSGVEADSFPGPRGALRERRAGSRRASRLGPCDVSGHRPRAGGASDSLCRTAFGGQRGRAPADRLRRLAAGVASLRPGGAAISRGGRAVQQWGCRVSRVALSADGPRAVLRPAVHPRVRGPNPRFVSLRGRTISLIGDRRAGL